jgi:hypothetical protein
MISFEARQKFRQRLQNIEHADEILNGLNLFLNRFIPLQASFYSSDWETIYEIPIEEGETVMISLSIIGRENLNYQAGLKRTGVFYKNEGQVFAVNVQQTDYTSRTNSGFDSRLLADSDVIKIQVKGNTNNFTQWSGSIEFDRLKG